LTIKTNLLAAFTLWLVLFLCGPTTAQTADLLTSWHDGKAKRSIVEFVTKVTGEGSPDFVIPAERIAVFDNDGTPVLVRLPKHFLSARIRRRAPSIFMKDSGQTAVKRMGAVFHGSHDPWRQH
jgi:hypothetical protein